MVVLENESGMWHVHVPAGQPAKLLKLFCLLATDRTNSMN